MRVKYKNFGLVCQGDIGHKMWGAVPMIAEGMYPDIVLSKGLSIFFERAVISICEDKALFIISASIMLLEKNILNLLNLIDKILPRRIDE